MASVPLSKFYCLAADLPNGKHDWSNHTLKLLLTNSAPTLSNTQRANISDIASGNGYTTNGLTLTTLSSTQASGLYKLIIADFTLLATGNIPSWRYAVLYNSSSAGQPLIGWYDYGTSVTMTNGEGFLFDFDGTNGVINLTLVV